MLIILFTQWWGRCFWLTLPCPCSPSWLSSRWLKVNTWKRDMILKLSHYTFYTTIVVLVLCAVFIYLLFPSNLFVTFSLRKVCSVHQHFQDATCMYNSAWTVTVQILYDECVNWYVQYAWLVKDKFWLQSSSLDQLLLVLSFPKLLSYLFTIASDSMIYTCYNVNSDRSLVPFSLFSCNNSNRRV